MAQALAVDAPVRVELPPGTATASGADASTEPRAGVVKSLLETTKPGITKLVTITSAVGFVLSAVEHSWTLGSLALAAIGSSIGVAMTAAGANSLNQAIERDRDAVMQRTAKRPLPESRVTTRQVVTLGVALSILGTALLWLVNGPAPAVLAAACILVYVFAYTPMKLLTPSSTLVGTIPGAIPPMIGWSAAAGGGFESALSLGSLSLYALMTVWQIPHFFAIAWMYRDDYARGGFCVLPTRERGELRTVRAIVVWTMLLAPATIAPGFLVKNLGLPYVGMASLTYLGFLWLVVKLARIKDRPSARKVFFASIAHLPLLIIAMVCEALVRVWLARG